MSLPIPEHAYRTYSIGECDCCGKQRELTQSFMYGGTEVWACWECRGEPDPAEEDGCLCPDAWCPLHGGRELEDRA